MVKKLVRHGNSWALVLDRPILELLRITPRTPLRIETNGRELVVAPAQSLSRKARFRRALSFVLKEHEATLRRLAR